ncbi:hypothetical protein [Clostridium sp. Cult2]|uniref:hypothetical protein n=1 Tax=Clostridium sp. Cult2 TaxID=2079003 RepID=UPI001F2B35FB|nr:hypothetical protein [Clostridium sp. Cult2]MCF6465629.1 hypothetical protein [Clostridium sp. Cult2]
MNKDKGFISINALFIMVITLISALFLIYTSNQEYLIINSSKNNIQAYYLAESKIHMVLNKEEYYYGQLLPRIETYLKYGRLGPTYDGKISLDNKDLFEDDNNNIVNLSFAEENKRRILEFKTSSTYFGISKNILAKMTIINDLFEMWIPIVSIEHIQQDKVEEFTNYMLHLQEKIEIPKLPNGIKAIDAIDYEEVKIINGLDNRINIEFFRNNIDEPVKREILVNEEIFLLLRNSHTVPILSIASEKDWEKVKLKGIIHVEGDLIINSDFELDGIVILHNGQIIINPSKEVKIHGIILLNNCYENLLDYEKVQINYNYNFIKEYGIYLPKFIEPKIQHIKNY